VHVTLWKLRNMQNITCIVKLPYCVCYVLKAKKYAKCYVHCMYNYLIVYITLWKLSKMQNVTWIVNLPYCACNVVKVKKYAKCYVDHKTGFSPLFSSYVIGNLLTWLVVHSYSTNLRNATLRRWRFCSVKLYLPVLPDGIFSNQKSQLG
jgi:hypothetical protein